jgi:hypothetical protein
MTRRCSRGAHDTSSRRPLQLTMASRFCAMLVASGCVLLSSGAAFARDSAAGEALYRAAKESAKKGDWEKACAQFAESQRLDPAPGTLANLADCEEHRGLVTSAWTHFTEVQTQFKPGDARATYAREHAAALEKRIPRLTIRLQAGAPASARVFRDEEELRAASLGVPLPVDPGAHVVVVKVGTAEARFPVTAVESQTTEVLAVAPAEVAIAPAKPDPTTPAKPVEPPTPIEKPPATPGDNRTLGWVLVGTGAAGIAVGGVTGVLALSNAGKVKDTCGPNYTTCDSTSVDNASTGQTMATVSTVAFIAGGVFAAAGLYFVITAPAKTTATTAPRTGISVGPTGALLRGTF